MFENYLCINGKKTELTDAVYFPYSMHKADINCENIKAVLRRVIEIMFGAVNA